MNELSTTRLALTVIMQSLGVQIPQTAAAPPSVAPDSVAAVRDGAAARVGAKARDGEAALSPTTSPGVPPTKQTKAT